MRAKQVTEFHETYRCPVHQGKPTQGLDHMSSDRIGLRLNLILEETRELLRDGFGIDTEITFTTPHDGGKYKNVSDAVHSSRQVAPFDIVGAADALGDLSYVVDGFALEAGIPLDEVITEIHASNMSKLGEDGEPIFRGDGKVLKGPNFREPDITSVIFKKAR